MSVRLVFPAARVNDEHWTIEVWPEEHLARLTPVEWDGEHWIPIGDSLALEGVNYSGVIHPETVVET